MVVMMFVIPLIFTLKVNGQVVSSEPTKTEINQLFKTVPLEKIDKYGVPVKEPKFSASVGMGSSYDLGEEKAGIIKFYKKSSVSSLRLGYSLSKYVEIQGEYSFDTKFKGKEENTSYSESAARAYSTFTLNLKAGVPVTVKKFNFYPYLVVGLGKANTTWSGYYKSTVTEFDYSYNSNGMCSKGGMGVEVNLHKNIYLFLELNNWKVNWTNSFDQQRYVFFYKQILTGLTLKF
jgi:hypothetical protein